MNRRHQNEAGFTLIELIVVLVIMGVFLFFTIPNFHKINLFSGGTQALGKTVLLIESLKTRAVTDNKNYLMHVDLDAGLVWVSDEAMDGEQTDGEQVRDEQTREAKTGGIQFSENTTLVGVEFTHPLPPDMNKDGDEFLIRFYKQGHSDMALIHLRDEDKDYTIMIEPFVSKVELYERAISFDRCFQ